jgi:hypothetical protein
MKRWFLSAILLVFVGPVLAADVSGDDPGRAARIAVMRAEVQNLCDKYAPLLQGDKLHGHATRELTHIAHDLLVLGGDVNEVQTLVSRAFAEQDMDPNSPRYGTVPWAVGVRAEVEDANAIEFTCLPAGAIMTKYRAQLSPQFVREIAPHLHAALVAIRRHNVNVAYTNIYLMKISNLLLLGEAVGDDDAVKLGLSNLDKWIEYTRKNGIAEYNSPTYAATQINSASVAYDCTSNAQARALLHSVLDYLWADACANYYAPTQQLAGASSRDYDFLYGSGGLDRCFFYAGLREEKSVPALLNDTSGPFCDAVETSYRPTQQMLDLALQTDKSMVSGYGPDAAMDRTLYSTAAFSVGTAGSPYGAQDREIGVRFGSGRKLAIVSVFLDPYDAPDGSVKVIGKDNHSKPGHLHLDEAVVQDKGSVLAVYNLAPGMGKAEYSSIGLNMILPAHTDDLWLDGQKVDDSDISAHPCTENSVVVIREGKAMLAARMFGVGGFNHYQPAYFLKHDIAKGDAFRLVAYAYRGPSTALRDKHVPGAVIIDVEPCENDRVFADFLTRSQSLAKVDLVTDSEIWHAMYGPLEAAFNTATEEPEIRRVNGIDVQITGPARVNGWDLGDLLPPVEVGKAN